MGAKVNRCARSSPLQAQKRPVLACPVRTEVARPERFERPTPRFVVWCSIQLSYGRVFCLRILGRKDPAMPRAFGNTLSAGREGAPLLPAPARLGKLCKNPSRRAGALPRSASQPLSKQPPEWPRDFERHFHHGRTRKPARSAPLRPGPLVADTQELDRPVRYGDPEGGADRSFHQMNLAAMGTNQLGGNR
jgi:hypothetical protein